MIWLKFLLCLAIILFAGAKLARYGDIIAEKTGLGRIWIGLMLLAGITSAPELVTSVSSVALVDAPDLALGTLLGSCLFNLTILALLDILYRPAPVLSRVSSRHMISAGMGILLIAVAAGDIFIRENSPGLTLGWIGALSIIILVLYLASAWRTFRFERSHQPQPLQTSPRQYDKGPVGKIWLKFALAAGAVVGAGIWLSFVGNEIAETTGWGANFIGSLFLAIATSMPEMVVAIAALRLGAIDMAVADILGANMLDITHIFTVDLFYTQGAVLSSVSRAHLITAAVVVVMNLVIILGLRFRQQRKALSVISWYGPVLIGLYIFGACALFSSGIGLG